MTYTSTRIGYMYRDANNYKKYHQVVLPGTLSMSQIQDIQNCLEEGLYFIPSQVGLEELQFQMIGGYQEDVDHPFHELHVVTLTEEKPTLFSPTAEAFHQKFVYCRTGHTNQAPFRYDLGFSVSLAIEGGPVDIDLIGKNIQAALEYWRMNEGFSGDEDPGSVVSIYSPQFTSWNNKI